MKIKIFLIAIILIGICPNNFSQSRFRSGVFLHHSTGANIWGPNGSSTSIPQQMTIYNATKGYSDSTAVSMNEVWFPGSGIGNDWFDWHWIFDNLDPNNNIYPFLAANKIVVIKSCFPSSNITGYGSPDDTSGSGVTYKTIYNYKWHWRSILDIMKQHPENFFVIWTNAPLVAEATNSTEARLTNEFCTWAKDTLANGNDPVYGAFPPNVYVFDFFHKLAMPSGYMNPAYQVQSGDSHPNAAATELVAPQFVQEVFDAAIAYETIIPVEITLFEGSFEGDVVNLKWITATETNNFGFEVERASLSASPLPFWEKIGFVNGNGTTTNRVTYNFTDKNILSSRYYYRLKQIDMDGTYEYSNEVLIEINTLNEFQLFQNYPNPFNPSTEIFYVIPKSGKITLKVYNIIGSEVATLVDGFVNAGKHSIKFNAKDFASGIYFYRMNTDDNFISARKMLLVK